MVDVDLTAEDWAGAAWLLRCDVPAMRAVALVESSDYGPFIAPGEPTILFERHVFHRLTGGKFDTGWPDLSNPDPGGYGAAREQHHRLARAVALDRDAALKSASWGLFQVMGYNHERAGYSTLQAFINAMFADVGDHLRAFACFIHLDSVLERALREHDWSTLARWYNGPGYKGSPATDLDDYDRKLRVAYDVARAT